MERPPTVRHAETDHQALPAHDEDEAVRCVAMERMEFLEAQELMEGAVRSAKPNSVSKAKKLRVYDRTPHRRILRATLPRPPGSD
jgi:hypothetical protein